MCCKLQCPTEARSQKKRGSNFKVSIIIIILNIMLMCPFNILGDYRYGYVECAHKCYLVLAIALVCKYYFSSMLQSKYDVKGSQVLYTFDFVIWLYCCIIKYQTKTNIIGFRFQKADDNSCIGDFWAGCTLSDSTVNWCRCVTTVHLFFVSIFVACYCREIK